MSKITVSDQFIEIYQNFTKENQVENMNKLTKEELYFLIINVLDNLDEENPILQENIKSFRKETMEILHIQKDKKTSNPVLLKLIEASGKEYIFFDEVVDQFGNEFTL
jgi:hypothetical protein